MLPVPGLLSGAHRRSQRFLQTKKELNKSLVTKYPKSEINGLWEERSRQVQAAVRWHFSFVAFLIHSIPPLLRYITGTKTTCPTASSLSLSLSSSLLSLTRPPPSPPMQQVHLVLPRPPPPPPPPPPRHLVLLPVR